MYLASVNSNPRSQKLFCWGVLHSVERNVTEVITFLGLSGDLYAPDALSSLLSLVPQVAYDLMSQGLLSCDSHRIIDWLGLQRILKRSTLSALPGKNIFHLTRLFRAPSRKKILSRIAAGRPFNSPALCFSSSSNSCERYNTRWSSLWGHHCRPQLAVACCTAQEKNYQNNFP